METLQTVKEKCSKISTAVEKAGKMTPMLRQALLQCRTTGDLEHVYAPYKTGSKASLAERARKMGLEEVATALLEGKVAWIDRSILNSKYEKML